MRKYIFTYMACLVMLLFGFAACSPESDAPDNGGGGNASKTCTLHFTLSPVSAGESGTRSTSGPTWVEGSADENMKSWIVVAVNATSTKVEAIAENKNVAKANRTKDEVVLSGLKAGVQYDVYSFANLTLADLGNPKVGKEQPNASDGGFGMASFAVAGNDFDVKTKGIPMSNSRSIIISEDGKKAYDESNAVEVKDLWTVRMLSKITLKFKNLTNKDITVNSVSISDITSNPSSGAKNIYLLPSVAHPEGNAAVTRPALSADAVQEEFTHQITSGSGENQPHGITIPANTANYDASDDGEHSVTFYVNESKAGKQYPYFVVTLNTNIGDQRYFMYTDWNQICRNDHHVLKMALSDYKLRLKVEGYSAIGMLPSLEDDGKQLNLTFHMPDDEFHIIPEVTKYSDTSNTPVAFTDVKWEKLSESETDAETKAFSTIPKLDTRTGYIEGTMLGELGKNIGPVVYQLSVKVNDGTADAPTLVYRVAINQDLSWYTSSARKHFSTFNNIERKFYRYE